MGREVMTIVKTSSATATAEVLLESNEIICRGELKLKFSFSAMKSLKSVDGWLKFKCDGEDVAIHLEDAADAWLKRIKNPPSRATKLRVKKDDSVLLLGAIEDDVKPELTAARAKIVAKLSDRPSVVLYFIETLVELKKLSSIEKSLADGGAVWVLWPKGADVAVRHEDVVSAGRACGLNQTISIGFSPRFTGLRLVRAKK
jgi:hypothetical protein